jgi:hypothetical protein
VEAKWHHVVRVRVTYRGATKDYLLWQDSHHAGPTALDVATEPEWCAPGSASSATPSTGQFGAWTFDNIAGNAAARPVGPPPAAPSSACRAAKPFLRALSRGSVGDDVLELQKTLTCLNYLPAGHKATRTFGTLTQKAVRAFQKDRGIAQTGTVGPLTRQALNSLP